MLEVVDEGFNAIGKKDQKGTGKDPHSKDIKT
jgi:hypothetical protein